MKRKVIPAATTAVLALAASHAAAQVYYEPFNYAASTTTALDDGLHVNAGQGTFWAKTGTSAGIFTVDSNNLTPSAIAPATLPPPVGGSVVYPTSGTGNAERSGFGQVVRSGTVYYSLNLKLNALPASTTGAFIAGFNNFALTQSGAPSVLGTTLAVKKIDASTYQVGIRKGDATFTWDTSHNFTVDDTVFIVGSYTINGDVAKDDTENMWVNPTTSFGSAAAPTATLPDLTSGGDLGDALSPAAASVASFVLRSNSVVGAPVVDELRIDTSWAGVVPDGTLQWTWNSAAGGNWSDNTQWNDSTGTANVSHPGVLGAIANFGPGIADGSTITVDGGGQTVDTINIDNPNSLTISGAALTIDTNASAGQIIALQGNHTIAAPLILNKDVALKTAGGATLTLGSTITGAGKTISKYGAGTLKLGADNQIDDGATLAVRAGVLDLNGHSETVDTVVLGVGHNNTGASNGGPDLLQGNIIGTGTLSANTLFSLETGTISGTLSGTAALTKVTAGNVTLSGTNTYAGATNVNLGTLHLAGGNAIPDTSPVNMATSGGGTLDLANSNETIGSLSGGGTNAGTIALGTGTLTVNQTASTTYSGAITGSGGSVIKQGAGTLVLGGNSSYGGGTTINAGTVSVGANGNLGATGGGVTFGGGTLLTTAGISASARNVTLNAGGGTVDTGGFDSSLGDVDGTGDFTKTSTGKLTVNHVRTTGNIAVPDGTLIIAPNAQTAGASVAAGVSVGATGNLDLKDNKLIVTTAGQTGSWNGSAYSGVTGQVAAGRGDGTWNGNGIITSVAGAADYTSLGVASASDVKGLSGTATDTFAGQTVHAGDTLVMYTYGGDANLDGQVNIDDYTQIDSSVSVGGALKGWFNGDFNYDGNVDIDDYTIIDSNITIQGAPFSTAGGVSRELPGVTAVPEPASLALFAAAAGGLLVRRRRTR